MQSQHLFEAYILSSPKEAEKYCEPLAQAIVGLVKRAIAKHEAGDLEDFEQDCILAIWTKIAAIKADPSSGSIDNIEAFIRQSVHNRYCDAIRRKRPKWYNLKLELMELFSGKANVEGFAMWVSADGEKMCGFSTWKEGARPASGRCRELLDRPDAFRKRHLQNRDPSELPLWELAALVLDYCGGPVEIDILTNAIAELTHAKTPEPLSIDAVPDDDDDAGAPVDWLISPDTDVEKQVVDGSWFRHVMEWFWREFTGLSLKQRKAVLYGMAADQAMAIGTVVGLNELAKSLEITLEELASLISELPMPDALTAEELGVPARAVPSIRFKAWGRIRRRTRKSSLTLEED